MKESKPKKTKESNKRPKATPEQLKKMWKNLHNYFLRSHGGRIRRNRKYNNFTSTKDEKGAEIHFMTFQTPQISGKLLNVKGVWYRVGEPNEKLFRKMKVRYVYQMYKA